MKPLMRRCNACNRYTLEKICPICKSESTTPHPPKFSPEDKYVRYRIHDRYKSKEISTSNISQYNLDIGSHSGESSSC